MINGNRATLLDRRSCFLGSHRLAFGRLAVLLFPIVNGCAADGADTPLIADLPQIEIEQDLRIDGNLANLVPIRWMGVSPDGTAAVFQDQLRGVRFFDPSGNDLGVVGREGEGPGEFMGPISGGWIGDTLWVSDFRLKRITLISTEPAFLRTLPPFTGARPAPEDEARLPQVLNLLPYALYPGGRLLIAASGGEVFEGSALFQVSLDGLVERLVLEIPRDPQGSVVVRSEGRSSNYGVPFFPRPRYTVAPDGSRIGILTTAITGPEAGTFRVSIYDSTGGEIFSRAYPYQGVPIPDHVVDSALAPRDPGPLPPGITATRPRRPPSVERELRSRVPPIYPPVREILLGMDRRTWIRLYRGDGREEWLILDADGDPQGRAVFPARTKVSVVTATHVWALESDEFDVESIVRFRLHEQE